jgi:hypothetical protein
MKKGRKKRRKIEAKIGKGECGEPVGLYEVVY